MRRAKRKKISGKPITSLLCGTTLAISLFGMYVLFRNPAQGRPLLPNIAEIAPDLESDTGSDLEKTSRYGQNIGETQSKPDTVPHPNSENTIEIGESSDQSENFVRPSEVLQTLEYFLDESIIEDPDHRDYSELFSEMETPDYHPPAEDPLQTILKHGRQSCERGLHEEVQQAAYDLCIELENISNNNKSFDRKIREFMDILEHINPNTGVYVTMYLLNSLKRDMNENSYDLSMHTLRLTDYFLRFAYSPLLDEKACSLAVSQGRQFYEWLHPHQRVIIKDPLQNIVDKALAHFESAGRFDMEFQRRQYNLE